MTGQFTRLGLLFTAMLMAAGCASDASRDRHPGGEIEEALEEGANQGKDADGDDGGTPENVDRALMPDVGLNVPAEATEETFDVAVSEMPARSFFMGLVRDTPYNMVVHPEVSGTISLDLKNVTVPEVMKTVRDVYGYAFQTTRSGFLVMPNKIQTRIFQVDYLDMKRKGQSRTRVSSGQATEAGGGQQQQGRQGIGQSQAISQGGDQQGQTATSTRIETESESDFWESIETTLEAVVPSADGRKVVVNSQAGIVVVRGMPGELRTVTNYLDSIEASVTRQVILEAKIIEVELNDRFQSGINWGALADNSLNGNNVFAGQVDGPNLFEDGFSNFRNSPFTIDPANGTAPTSFQSETFGGTFALSANVGDFSALIELLDQQGDTHVLSSPRVSTVNNQKAVIKVGSDEFFVTGIESNTVTGGATSQNRQIILTPFFSGIALDVTPQIDESGSVTLHIHPTVSEVRDQRKQLTVGGQTDSLPLAFSEVRESDSIVRADSGQIVVIGGLMKTELKDETFSTPFLGDIPLLGHLFKQKQQIQTKTELVILLKPTVIDTSSDWSDMARDSLERIRSYGPAARGDQ